MLMRILFAISSLSFCATSTAQDNARTLGNKSYEVSNHLGNVMTVVSDRKTPTPETPNKIIAYNETDIKSYNDYYPYGMVLDNRNDNSDYKYGFQGQEKDNEVKGRNNSINYKYRVHDPRLGRFFAVDPLAGKYPYNSTYAFSENTIINAVELEGLESYGVIEYRVAGRILKVEYIKIQSNNLSKYIRTVNLTSNSSNFRLLNGLVNRNNNYDFSLDKSFRNYNTIRTDSIRFYPSQPITIAANNNRIGDWILMTKTNDFFTDELNVNKSKDTKTLTLGLISYLRYADDQASLTDVELSQNNYLNEILTYARAIDNLNNPNITYQITVTGMASNAPTNYPGGNQQLSTDRAANVRQYLIDNGIPANRITSTIGVGNSQATGNAANDRRTNVQFTPNL